jgi:guanylate kinase
MLVVITGPSGVGKTTIIKSLLKADPNLQYSISLTTRERRQDEVDEAHYHFVSEAEFLEGIRRGEFAEWSEVYGKYYGRRKRELDELMSRGHVLVGIDPQGAEKLQNLYPEGVFIFLLPKSEAALEAQLRGRKTDDEDSIKVRLDAALQEMQQADNFGYVVVNNRIDETVREVQSILRTEEHWRRSSDQQTGG